MSLCQHETCLEYFHRRVLVRHNVLAEIPDGCAELSYLDLATKELQPTSRVRKTVQIFSLRPVRRRPCSCSHIRERELATSPTQQKQETLGYERVFVATSLQNSMRSNDWQQQRKLEGRRNVMLREGRRRVSDHLRADQRQ